MHKTLASSVEVLPPPFRGFDLARLSKSFLDDPYPTYTALREHSPVHRLADGSFFLTRYDDVAQVYRDTATWSSDKRIDFRPNFAVACFMNITRRVLFSTIRQSTRAFANCSRQFSHHGRSKPSSRGSRAWSIGCSTMLLERAWSI